MKRLSWWGEVILLLALAGAATAATYFFRESRPALYLRQEAAPEGALTVTEALEAAKNPGVLWIDARSRASFTKQHIPGAMLLSQQEADYQDLLFQVATTIQTQQEKWIVVYCDGKKCEASHKIAEELRAIHPNPDQIHVLHGGWEAWAEQQR
jgi:rhodanese-related sulfurtransferase